MVPSKLRRRHDVRSETTGRVRSMSVRGNEFVRRGLQRIGGMARHRRGSCSRIGRSRDPICRQLTPLDAVDEPVRMPLRRCPRGVPERAPLDDLPSERNVAAESHTRGSRPHWCRRLGNTEPYLHAGREPKRSSRRAWILPRSSARFCRNRASLPQWTNPPSKLCRRGSSDGGSFRRD